MVNILLNFGYMVNMYTLINLNRLLISESLATFLLVGETIFLKDHRDNCFGLKIPKDEVAHYLQLAVAADIAELTLAAAGEPEVTIEEFKKKI